MIALYFLPVFLAFLYIFIITNILTSWQEINEWETSPSFKPDLLISVIVPYRNESTNIKSCLESVLRSNYPKSKLEIITVDDYSDDQSKMIVDALESKILQSTSLVSGGGKKDAIKQGIKLARGTLIVTLDADCLVSPKWLRNIASFYSYTKKKMIVGMVEVEGKKNILEYFQVMDTCGSMGLHGAGIQSGSHFLGNGANLAFEKTLFEEMKPFEGNQFASGDDVFFLNQVAKNDKDDIGFLKSKNAVVSTKAEKTWKKLWHQRKRWATKNNAYSKGVYKYMTTVVWLLSLSILINLLLIPFTSGLSLFVALTQILIKGIMDFLYLQNMCAYFDKSKVLKYFIPAFIIQTLYILVAGVLTLSKGTYVWKNRRLR